MSKPLPKTSGIGTTFFRETETWMAYWLPYHWGFRGWGDSEAAAIADLKKRDPYKATELAKAEGNAPEVAGPSIERKET